MTSNDAARLQALFAAALELPEAARSDFLERECAGYPALLEELRGLLAVDAKLVGMTARPVGAALSEVLASVGTQNSLTGARVGAFELREELGRGGMGSVYRAERVDGVVAQQVAIKFVRRDVLDANTIRRFQLERQLMASLDHPNIARLFDAAELDDGTPYFVMEYVAGVPITDYAERGHLTVRERVVLMRQVCAAVAEAHRKLIVHRDLKPSNILVSDGGTPKLLDFGIAKPLAQGASIGDETGTAQRYFSPNYAAPEQLTGAATGVACDIYALGLLLYELLAGVRPFDFSGLSAGQVERLITDVPPGSPSQAAARSDGPDSAVRARQLRGDLDGIVLRCVRKVPSERYGSVEQLEADLCNYLEGRPVQARGGHGWYRAHKFVRRNFVAVTASLLTAIALITGVIAFAWQARIAEQRAAQLERVSKFQAEMLKQVNPTQAGVSLTENVSLKFDLALLKLGVPDAQRAEQRVDFIEQWRLVNATDVARDLIDHTILRPATEAIDRQFADQPLVAAALRQVLADRYLDLALYEIATSLQSSALETRRSVLGNQHPDTLMSVHSMGVLLSNRSQFVEGQQFLREALAGRRRVLGDDHPDTLSSIYMLGIQLAANGNLDAGEPFYLEAIRRRRQVLGADHPDTLASINSMGALLQAQGKLIEAEQYYREGLEIRRRALGQDHPDTLVSLASIGLLLRERGEFDESEGFLREALQKRRRVLGDEHRSTLNSISSLGLVLQSRGRLPEAETYFREALDKSRRVLGAEHVLTLNAISNLSSLLVAQDRNGETVELLAPAEEAMRISYTGSNLVRLAKALMNLGKAQSGLGVFAAAEKNLLEASDIFDRNPSPTATDARDCIQALVDLYSAWHVVAPGHGYDVKAKEVSP